MKKISLVLGLLISILMYSCVGENATGLTYDEASTEAITGEGDKCDKMKCGKGKCENKKDAETSKSCDKKCKEEKQCNSEA